ncbi:EAL domain-containing protein [Hydrogenivirga sp.]
MNEQVFKNLPVVIYEAEAEISERKFRIKSINFLNDWVEKLTGWSIDEIKANPDWLFENIHPEDREKILVECRELSEGNDLITRSYRLRRKDGRFVYILDTTYLLECIDENSIKVLGVWEDISQEQTYYDVFAAIDNAPAVGMLIYQKGIVYANRAASEMFGYEPGELIGKPVHELVTEEYTDYVKDVAARRLKGEQFDRIYAELPILRKDGTVGIAYTFTRTIYWRGEPAGLVIFFEITKQKKFERLFRVLKDINQLIISAYDDEELLSEVCALLVDRAGFRMVWVGVPDEKTKYVKPIKVCGHDEGYVSRIRISIDESTPEGRGPTGSALREGKIVVNPDTRTNPAVAPWREEMLKRRYLSSCAIPLQLRGKTVGVLNIYSSTPNMFSEEELELLREIQRDISFALERIEKEKFMKLINTAIEKGHEWVLITDEEGNIIYVNRAVEEISGYSQDELLGKNPRIFKSGYHTNKFYRSLWRTIKSGRSFQAVFVNKKKDGELFYLDQTITPVGVGKKGVRFVAFGKDITSEKYLEEEIARLKYLDALTGLPNRDGFLAAVSLNLEKEKDNEHALFLIDILDFSGLNEVYGSEIGNEILRKVASLIRNELFNRDVVSRVGGDEFAVLARGISEKDLTTITDKLFNLFSAPIQVDGKSIKVNINVGASLYPRDAKTAQELIEKASTALSFAKKEGENTYRFFSKDINKMVQEHFRWRTYLEKAIREDRFIFYFQPIYSLPDLKVVGCETLLRLRGPRGKILTPGEFIFVLEKTGLIREVEDRMLEKLKEFIVKHKRKYMVTFNVSPKSFRDERFLKKVKKVAKSVGRNMVLEITERLFVEDPDYAMEFLEDVRSTGVKVAIDDFGTGYSSLAYLERLPVDVLKIDMSFVHKMNENPKSLAVVETIIELARKLGIETIAEGVEDEEQLKLLKLLGCNYVQGYHLSKPMSEKQIERVLV